ncbi:MAG: ROK family protein [Clostridiales bacterium]|nr:ROK family protein [Clostridiales bacterium]
MSGTVWGLDIGGTKCALVAADEYGSIRWRRQLATADYRRWEELLDALLIDTPSETPLAVGVSCGGPLDSKRGVILSPPNLPGWDDVPITDWLTERLGVPVFLQNDANACALAEWRYGAGKGCGSMVFLTFGTGFGAGLILDGRLYTGITDMAGEVGHVRAARTGPVGYGKAGSYEGFCSGGGIAQLSGGVSAKEVVRLADSGDRAMRRVLTRSARYLGRCLAMLIDTLNPERIVIGSIYARAERYFAGEALRIAKAESHPLSWKACQILPAALGDAIGDIAAVTVAMNGLGKTEYPHGRADARRA